MLILLSFSVLLVVILWLLKGLFSEGYAGTALSAVLSLLCAVFGEPLRVWALGIDKKIFRTSPTLVSRSCSLFFPAPELSFFLASLLVFCVLLQGSLSSLVWSMVKTGQIIFPLVDTDSAMLINTQLGTITIAGMLPSLLLYGFILPLTKRTMLAKEVFTSIFVGVVLALLFNYALGQWDTHAGSLLIISAVLILALVFSGIVLLGQLLGRVSIKQSDIRDNKIAATFEESADDKHFKEINSVIK